MNKMCMYSLFGLDILLGVALLAVILLSGSGCTAEQVAAVSTAVDTAADAVSEVAPTVATTTSALATVATSLGWPAWIILVLNVCSSTASAIVAALKKTTTTTSS